MAAAVAESDADSAAIRRSSLPPGSLARLAPGKPAEPVLRHRVAQTGAVATSAWARAAAPRSASSASMSSDGRTAAHGAVEALRRLLGQLRGENSAAEERGSQVESRSVARGKEDKARAEGASRKRRKGPRKALRRLLAGATAAVVAKTAVAPLERLKLEYMLAAVAPSRTMPLPPALPAPAKALAHTASTHWQGLPLVLSSAAAPAGMLAGALQSILREEGWQGLWRGNGVNLLRVVPFKALNFFLFDVLREQLAEHRILRRLPLAPSLLLQKQSGTPGMASSSPGMHGGEGGGSDRQEKGLRRIPHPAVDAVSNLERAVAGAASGTLAAILCFPLDTVRTRLMARGGTICAADLRSCVVDLVRAEGPRSLYRGLLPALLSMAPAGAVFYGTYDFLKALHLRALDSPVPEGATRLPRPGQHKDGRLPGESAISGSLSCMALELDDKGTAVKRVGVNIRRIESKEEDSGVDALAASALAGALLEDPLESPAMGHVGPYTGSTSGRLAMDGASPAQHSHSQEDGPADDSGLRCSAGAGAEQQTPASLGQTQAPRKFLRGQLSGPQGLQGHGALGAHKPGHLGVVPTLLYGALAGATAEVVTFPLEVVRRKMQLQGALGQGGVQGMRRILGEIVRNGGVGALYSGLLPATLQVLPSASISYLVFELMKGWLRIE